VIISVDITVGTGIFSLEVLGFILDIVVGIDEFIFFFGFVIGFL